MAPFAAWRSTEQLAGERLIAEPEADDGFTASPPDGARGSPVQIATPESRRGSGVRRARSPGSGAFAGPSGSGTGGRGGNRRRRLDFDAAADNSQVPLRNMMECSIVCERLLLSAAASTSKGLD